MILKRLCNSTKRSSGTYSIRTKPRLACRSTRSGRASSRQKSTTTRRGTLHGDAALLECSEAATEDCRDVLVVPEFVSTEEEGSLLQEIDRTLRGKKYLYNHWDGVT